MLFLPELVLQILINYFRNMAIVSSADFWLELSDELDSFNELRREKSFVFIQSVEFKKVPIKPLDQLRLLVINLGYILLKAFFDAKLHCSLRSFVGIGVLCFLLGRYHVQIFWDALIFLIVICLYLRFKLCDVCHPLVSGWLQREKLSLLVDFHTIRHNNILLDRITNSFLHSLKSLSIIVGKLYIIILHSLWGTG